VHETLAYQPQSWYARFIRSLDFIHRLQDGFTAEHAEEQTRSVRAELEQAPRLSFDDFGKGHFTPWVMQEYSSLFDYRAMAGLPTFLTTNLSPRQMREQYGDYLIGRMLQHIQIIHVEGPDTRFISVLREFSGSLAPRSGHGAGRGSTARRASPARRWQVECIIVGRTAAPLCSHPSRAASVLCEPQACPSRRRSPFDQDPAARAGGTLVVAHHRGNCALLPF
jgi:hypothetical protein